MQSDQRAQLGETDAELFFADAFREAIATEADTVSDEELAIVAREGIPGIHEEHRDRVLRAIASNQGGAEAVFDVAEMVRIREARDAGSSDGVSSGSGFWRRAFYPAFALAASVLLVSTIGFAISGNASGTLGAGGTEGNEQFFEFSMQTERPNHVVGVEGGAGQATGVKGGEGRRWGSPWVWGIVAGGAGVIALLPVAVRRVRGG